MAWTARNYVISLLLFSAIIALAYVMVGGLATEYDANGIVDANFKANYDKLDSNTADVQDMLDTTSSGGGILNTADILWTSTLSVVNIIFGSLNIFRGQIASIGSDFGVPTAITSILLVTFMGIITLSIILIVINAINKVDKL